jgi:hypothetical protein
VKRVVLLSGSSAPVGDMTNAITHYLVRSEIAVRAPFPTVLVAAIDPSDIGAVVAEALVVTRARGSQLPVERSAVAPTC